MPDRRLDQTLAAAESRRGTDETSSASVEHALAEQRERWGRGDRAPVEAFLEQVPALRHDVEGILCLIFNEVVLREERGESPRAEEFQQRFPHLAAPIALQFGMDEALRPDTLGSGTVDLPPGSPVPTQGTAAEPHPPGYEILAELGRGGMGVVYKARQLGFNRVVAVKMILAGAGRADREERFHTETEAVARLHHPHIVQVYEVGEVEGRPFFSMEFCPGGALDRRLNGTPMPSREAAALVEKLARALHVAHQAHVIHRDLKPANVLMTDDGQPKVTDFGLAKKLDEQSGQTQSGSVMGTPSYMAPEQAGGKSKEIGPAADVYALGAILYECLTGRPPFKAPSLLETLAQVVADDPVPPRRLQPKTPRDLETICLKCLEKAPARRYAAALELAEDLRRFAAGEPIRARRVGAPERAWKWARTHKTLAVLAVVVAAALLAGAVLTWQAAAQSLDLTRRGEQDLDEAAKLVGQSRWGEARAVLRQAREQLTGAGRADLLRKVQQTAADLETAAKLEEAPLLRTAPGRDGWDLAGAERAYREDFAGYGLDLETMDPAAAAARIRASAIKERLTEALDDWMLNSRDEDDQARAATVPAPAPGEAPADAADRKGGDTPRRRLFEVVRQADPDEWRCRVRTAALNKDRENLARLADDPTAGQLSPAMTVLLCEALVRTGARPKALALLRAAQLRNPDHFWLNYDLGYNLDQSRGAVQEDAVGFLRAALALRPTNAGVHHQLGAALLYRERTAEAEAEFRKALEIRPDFAGAHSALGYALNNQGRSQEAEAECRKALDLSPDLVAAHNNLGYVLLGQSRYAEAEAEYRKALETLPNYANAHNGLGGVFAARGRYVEAEIEYARAIRIQPDYAHTHFNLAVTYEALGKLTGAEAEYRKALEFKPLYAAAYLNLTRNLIHQGRFADALEVARKWRRETPPGDAAEKQADTEVQSSEHVAALAAKLPAVVRGETQPSSAHERLVYGRLCWYKGLYGASVRLCSDAFAADPKLAEDLSTDDCYYAARYAVLAAGGQGEDAKQTAEEERARWRRQALDWLQTDLARWAKRLEGGDAKSQLAVERSMRRWRLDPSLAGVRDADKLAALPQAEREPWRRLWAEVDDLIQRADAPKSNAP